MKVFQERGRGYESVLVFPPFLGRAIHALRLGRDVSGLQRQMERGGRRRGCRQRFEDEMSISIFQFRHRYWRWNQRCRLNRNRSGRRGRRRD